MSTRQGNAVLADKFLINFRRLLEDRGHGTQSKLARHLEVSAGYVSQLRSGECIPNLPTIELIADFFDTDAVDLLS